MDRKSVGLRYNYFLYYSSVADKHGVGQQRGGGEMCLFYYYLQASRLWKGSEDPLAKIMTA
jgi:hypothetical protein